MHVGAVFLKYVNHSGPVSSGVAMVADSIEDFEKIENVIIKAANEAKVRQRASSDSVQIAIKQAIGTNAQFVEFHIIEIDTEIFA
jgi:hypothetical protein